MSSQAVQGQWWSPTLDSLTGQDVGSCGQWWYKRVCSGLQRFDACVGRERSLDRPLWYGFNPFPDPGPRRRHRPRRRGSLAVATAAPVGPW